MGNRFPCPNCHAQHRFTAALAGKMRRCADCGFFFRVPLMPIGSAEGMDWPPDTLWRLRMGSGRQFGPVRPEVIHEWLREHRANADCLVSPEPGGEWYQLEDVFGGEVHHPRPAADPLQPEETPAARIPASGLLDFLPEMTATRRARSRRIVRGHQEVLRDLERECAATEGMVKCCGTKLVPLTHRRDIGQRGYGPQPLEAEAATVAAFRGRQGSEFYAIVPWGRLGRMPHEFLSILPGQLPSPVALRRSDEHVFGGGCWIGASGNADDVTAVAAARSLESLADGVEWEWFSSNRLYSMVLVWGVQGMPLGPGKFAHLMQSARHETFHGEPLPDLGLLWYLEKQRAFFKFARRLSVPGEGGTQVLFGCCGALFLGLAADALRE
ncbi:MAG: hypothetical protein EOP86_08870 [Verrucomicrobiaceae bacterium]|nr:MAG: hypothetical protein EOP86_08870 [Verrucomicrobiaceae bacterium]